MIGKILTIPVLILVSGFGSRLRPARMEPQTVSGPSVRDPVVPKQSAGTAKDLPPATKESEGQVRVMPDLIEAPPSPGSKQDSKKKPPTKNRRVKKQPDGGSKANH
jgi:hypothetical protein